MLQTCQKRWRGKEFETGHGELNGQWQAIQAQADCGNDASVCCRQLEVGFERLCTLHEEGNGRIL
jgi:hypothetical protein